MKDEKRILLAREHRQLTKLGVPLKKDGNRLDLRARRVIAAAMKPRPALAR
jgi:hypothetical protein